MVRQPMIFVESNMLSVEGARGPGSQRVGMTIWVDVPPGAREAWGGIKHGLDDGFSFVEAEFGESGVPSLLYVGGYRCRVIEVTLES